MDLDKEGLTTQLSHRSSHLRASCLGFCNVHILPSSHWWWLKSPCSLLLWVNLPPHEAPSVPPRASETFLPQLTLPRAPCHQAGLPTDNRGAVSCSSLGVYYCNSLSLSYTHKLLESTPLPMQIDEFDLFHHATSPWYSPLAHTPTVAIISTTQFTTWSSPV